MALSKQKFYEYSGYTSDNINPLAVDYFLSVFNTRLEQALGYRFTTVAQTESDKHNYYAENNYTAQSFISIGAWQESGLTLKLGSRDQSEETSLSSTALVLGKDYELFRFASGYSRIPTAITTAVNPVVAVKLLCTRMTTSDMLRVYGTWGFSNSLPKDLEYFLYIALKNALEINQSSSDSFVAGGSGLGGGAAVSIREYTTAVTFASSQVTYDAAKQYFENFLNTPTAYQMLMPYRISFTQQITQI